MHCACNQQSVLSNLLNHSVNAGKMGASKRMTRDSHSLLQTRLPRWKDSKRAASALRSFHCAAVHVWPGLPTRHTCIGMILVASFGQAAVLATEVECEIH